MKRFLLTMVSLMAFFGGVAWGDTRSPSYVYADVVDVRPVYAHYYNERMECTRRNVRHDRHRHSRKNELLGTILGGAIGYELGKNSRNKDWITAGGLVTGNLIGRNRDYRHHRMHTVEQICEPVRDYHERLSYYDVQYNLNGRVYSTRMDHDPGSQVRVSISHQVID